MHSRPALALVIALAATGCNDDTAQPTLIEPRLRDAFARMDRGIADARISQDAGLPDAAQDATLDQALIDMATADMAADMAPPGDMAPIDMDPIVDMAPPIDMAPPVDMAPDMAPIVDMAPPPEPEPMPEPMPEPDDPLVPPGRRACSRGPGWTLFEVHWSGGSSSARVDHWDAACEYSIRINDACGAFPRCGDGSVAGCGVEVVDGGEALLLDGRDDLLFRFSVQGIQFAAATLYFEARGTRGGAEMEIFSPLWGGIAGPIPGQRAYEALQVDWSPYLRVGDRPGLTGINFEASRSHVAIHSVELCLR